MYAVRNRYKPMLLVMDAVGNIIFFWTKLKKRPEKVRKVLFIRLEYIGDMVMATPVFETFKRNHPDCEVHVLCRSLTSPLIKNNPFVNKIIEYDAPWFGKREGERTKKSVISSLKKEKYDTVFEMHGDPRNNLLAFRTGSYSIGYSCRGGGFFLNETAAFDPNMRTINQNISLIKKFCTKLVQKTSIYTDRMASRNANNLMKRYGLKRKGFIIINPRSGRIEKDLTDDEVIKLSKKSGRFAVAITGSSSDVQSNKAFSGMMNAVNLTGKTDILTLVELVKNAEKVIAPDTGIVHIAKAVGTKAETIYKTTKKEVWGY